MSTCIRLLSAALIIGAASGPAVGQHRTGDSKVEEVVVTASALRKAVLETVQPVTVVEKEELVRARALSLGETLAREPGVSATYFGPQASRPVIRGLSGERVQMYEDGAEALDVSALSSDHAVTIDPLVADRVEILRGPATLLYGNGASGGLVNVLTHRIPSSAPQQPFGAAVELRGSSALDERAASGRFDIGTGPIAWHVDAFTRETDDVSIPGFALSRARREQLAAEGLEVDESRDRLGNSASESSGGALGGSFVGDWGFAGAAGSRYQSQYGIPGEEGILIDMEQSRYDFSAELNDLAGAIEALRFRASISDYEHAELEPDGAVGTLFFQDGVDGRVTLTHAPLAGWHGTVGIQHRSNDLQALGEEAFIPASDTRNVGYFIYEEHPLGPVTLEVGARLESQRIDVDETVARGYDEDSVSVSAGMLWKPASDYALAVNVISAERHPTSTELYANGPHLAASRFEIGDPSLRRERATTLDVGVRKITGPWQFDVSVFRSDYKDYTFAAPTALVLDDLPVVQYVQADASFHGAEAELRWPEIEIAIGDGLVLDASIMADVVRASLDAGGDLPQIPPLRFGGELRLEKGRVSAGLSAMWHDDQDRVAAGELPTEGFTLVDVDVSYRHPLGERELLFLLRGENLLDEKARRHASSLKDLAPLPGRGISGGVRLEL